jgi:chromate transport protein ChrA
MLRPDGESVQGFVVAVLAASIPSCMLVALLTGGFDAWSSQRLVQIAVGGALASSVGILLASFWLIVSPYLTRDRWIESIAIVGGSIVLSMYVGLSPGAGPRGRGRVFLEGQG